MTKVDLIRNEIIDKLLTISNKDYLSALYRIIETGAINDEIIKLSDEQKLMLQLSDKDIEAGRLISQSQLDKNDLEWLKGK